MPRTITTDPIVVPARDELGPFTRADLMFYEIDHSGPSFEARVFVNHPDATEETATSEEQEYLGSFYVFGHGGCYGEVGHCDVPRSPVSPFDRRGEHQLTPRTKILVITDSLHRLLEANQGGLSLTITVVAVVSRSPVSDVMDTTTILQVGRVRLLTYV